MLDGVVFVVTRGREFGHLRPQAPKAAVLHAGVVIVGHSHKPVIDNATTLLWR